MKEGKIESLVVREKIKDLKFNITATLKHFKEEKRIPADLLEKVYLDQLRAVYTFYSNDQNLAKIGHAIESREFAIRIEKEKTKLCRDVSFIFDSNQQLYLFLHTDDLMKDGKKDSIKAGLANGGNKEGFPVYCLAQSDAMDNFSIQTYFEVFNSEEGKEGLRDRNAMVRGYYKADQFRSLFVSKYHLFRYFKPIDKQTKVPIISLISKAGLCDLEDWSDNHLEQVSIINVFTVLYSLFYALRLLRMKEIVHGDVNPGNWVIHCFEATPGEKISYASLIDFDSYLTIEEEKDHQMFFYRDICKLGACLDCVLESFSSLETYALLPGEIKNFIEFLQQKAKMFVDFWRSDYSEEELPDFFKENSIDPNTFFQREFNDYQVRLEPIRNILPELDEAIVQLEAKEQQKSVVEVCLAQNRRSLARRIVAKQAKQQYSTPLHIVAQASSMQSLVKDIIRDAKEVVPLDGVDAEGNTPLHIAVKHCNAEAIHAFIKQGANLNARNQAGQTPLHVAAQAILSQQLIEELVNAAKKQGSLACVDNEGNTPLHMAVKHHNIKAIHVFVKYGANLNARNKKCQTPRALAAQLQRQFPGFDLEGLIPKFSKDYQDGLALFSSDCEFDPKRRKISRSASAEIKKEQSAECDHFIAKDHEDILGQSWEQEQLKPRYESESEDEAQDVGEVVDMPHQYLPLPLALSMFASNRSGISSFLQSYGASKPSVLEGEMPVQFRPL